LSCQFSSTKVALSPVTRIWAISVLRFASSPDLNGPIGLPSWLMNSSTSCLKIIILFISFGLSWPLLFRTFEIFLSWSSKVFVIFSKDSFSIANMFS